MSEEAVVGGDALLADTYVKLCLDFVIPMEGGTKEDLRKWWSDEKGHREQYGITKEQEDQLVAACKAQMSKLPDAPKLSQKELQQKRGMRRLI